MTESRVDGRSLSFQCREATPLFNFRLIGRGHSKQLDAFTIAGVDELFDVLFVSARADVLNQPVFFSLQSCIHASAMRR